MHSHSLLKKLCTSSSIIDSLLPINIQKLSGYGPRDISPRKLKYRERVRLRLFHRQEQTFLHGRFSAKCLRLKDGLWGIVDGSEAAPAETDGAYSKYISRCALAIIVLSVDPSLLYLLGDPTDPTAVWERLSTQFQKKRHGLTNWLFVDAYIHCS